MDSLSSRVELWSQGQLTGTLDIQIPNQLPNQSEWSLFFSLGRITWAKGGVHPLRRWQRLAKQYHPQSIIQANNVVEAAVMAGRENKILIEWVKRQKLPGEKAALWIRNTIEEILFDILQKEQFQKLTFVENLQGNVEASLVLVNAEQALQLARQTWKAWSKAGLANLSPNLAPCLYQPERLQQQISPLVYERLAKIIDGDRSLRDVAALMKQTPLLLARTLVPYIRQGAIKLETVLDSLPSSTTSLVQPKLSETDELKIALERVFPESPDPPLVNSFPQQSVKFSPIPGQSFLKQTEISPPESSTLFPSQLTPLIAYIDDSRWECLKMDRVIVRMGYRFLSIQDSLQALPAILESRPNLIFLDLIMPVVSGYELCTQLRRVSYLKETPIVIVTGNDGVIDRVRSRLLGATEFISKPIDLEVIQAILQKYCPLKR
jgi:chemotaxis family two-component system response regulator PixG